MAFTSEEIQTAVEKLVLSTVRQPYDTLGSRRTDVSFSDVQEAAAGVFILYPKSPYYCVFLGAQRVKEAVTALESSFGGLLTALTALGRDVLPVEDVSSLFNAKSALQALEGAVAKTAPMDITKLAAYQRFDSELGVFLDIARERVVASTSSGIDIVMTPQEARAALPGLLTSYRAAFIALRSSVTKLANALNVYDGVNLPSLVAKGVISKARVVLGDHATELDALSKEDRLLKIRAAVLDCLSAKASVKTFGSFTGMTEFVNLSGNGGPYLDANHPGVAASAVGDVFQPYNIFLGVNDGLTVTVDSGTPFNLALSASSIAVLSGQVAEAPSNASPDGYFIGNGTNPVLPAGSPPNNNTLKIRVKSLITTGLYTATIATSSIIGPDIQKRTAVQVCSDINAVLPPDVLAEPYFNPLYFQGNLDVSGSVGPVATFTIPGGSGTFNAVTIGSLLSVESGIDAGLWTVLSVSTTTLSATKLTGSATNALGVPTTIGPTDRSIRIRATNPTAQLPDELEISIVGDDDVSQLTAITLGFAPGLASKCQPTLARDIVKDLNFKTTKVAFSTKLDPTATVSVTTDPVDPTHLKMLKVSLVGNVVYVPGTITITIPGGGVLLQPIQLGDVVVLRGQNNTDWVITSINDTTIVATGAGLATTASGVSFDVGDSVTVLRWDAADVALGLNQGRYYVGSRGVPPTASILDIYLVAGIPVASDFTNGTALTFEAVIGEETVVFSSKNSTSLSSRIQLTGTGRPLFFSSAPDVQGGTPWFFLPSAKSSAAVGDMLELYGAGYNIPTQSSTVLSVDGAILQIEPSVSFTPLAWAFGQAPPPFAALRVGHQIDYSLLSVGCTDWLERRENLESYFTELNRQINPILVSKNPTPVQIADAAAALEAQGKFLTNTLASSLGGSPSSTIETSLGKLVVTPVPQIDTLLRTYKEKGSDRALDLLLAGSFDTFFAMTPEESSYAGTMQLALQGVARGDLPIRKGSRASAVQSRLKGTAESPDYEFTYDDTEGNVKPDVPADYEKNT